MVTIIFVFLWKLRTRVKLAGSIISIYFILNGLERFFIEKIRVNDTLFNLGSYGVTQAELIAVIFILFGGLLLVLLHKNIIPAPKKADNLSN